LTIWVGCAKGRFRAVPFSITVWFNML